MSFRTSPKIVGSRKYPLSRSAGRLPPVASVAPSSWPMRIYSSTAVRRASRMSGPTSTAGSAGSPTFSFCTKPTIFSIAASYRPAGTRQRVVAAQACPAWKKDGLAMPGAAASRSASSSTMQADLPPSSRCNRVRLFAAAAAMRLPIATLPVNEILSTSGLVTSSSAISGPSPVTTFTTPLGRSVSSMILATSRWMSGA